MSSLAQQLEKLSIPQARNVYGDGKKKKSLLFDPSEAALLDKETFYNLGVNGLGELETINDSFLEFETSLYAESSLTFERSVQSKEVNDSLNETISKFLLRLSPYCLLKPAHKCLEWLIFRYQIHQYNVDDLIMCVLPFHESKVFVRVIQLLYLGNKWDWLLGIKKSGVHLTKQTLINHCRTNPGFLHFICEMVSRSVKVHEEVGGGTTQLKTLFSFYSTTIIGVLDSDNIKEEIVSYLLTYISGGLKSKMVDYKASTYMILLQLVFKAKLKKDLVESFMKSICKHVIPELLTEAMYCILVLFQSQNLKSLKKSSFKNVVKQPGIEGILASMSVDYKCESLMQAFLAKLIPQAVKERTTLSSTSEGSDAESSDISGRKPQYLHILHSLMSTATLSEETTKLAIRNILESYVKFSARVYQDEEREDFNHSLRSMVRLLEARYSSILDAAVEDVLQQATDLLTRKSIQEFLNLSILSAKHTSLIVSGSSLTLSIYHQNYMVRKAAVEFLLSNIDKQDDAEFVSNALLSRLSDENPAVVDIVLSAGKVLWDKIQKQDDLLKSLENILRKVKDSWKSCVQKTVELLCECPGSLLEQVIPILLPFLLLVSADAEEMAKQTTILGSHVFTEHKVLKPITTSREISKAKKEKRNEVLIHCLSKELQKQGSNCMPLIRRWTHRQKNPRLHVFMILVLADILHSDLEESIRHDLTLCGVDLLLQMKPRMKRQDSSVPDSTLEGVLERNSQTLREHNAVDVSLISFTLTTILEKSKHYAHALKDQLFVICDPNVLDQANKASSLLLSLFRTLMDFSVNRNETNASLRSLVVDFSQIFLSSWDLLKFLGLIWTQHQNPHRQQLGLNSTIQAQALQIGLVHLQNTQENCQNLTEMLVTLLSVLSTPHKFLRESALSCVSALKDKMSAHELSLAVAEKVIKCSHEIIADHTYIQQVMQRVFTENPSTKKKRRSSTKGDKSSCLKVFCDLVEKDETPQYLKKVILCLLQQVQGEEICCLLTPSMEKILHLIKQKDCDVLSIHCLQMMLQKITLSSASLITVKSNLIMVVEKTMTMADRPGEEQPSVQEVILGQLNKDVYEALSPECREHLLISLIDAWVQCQDHRASDAIRRTIKHWKLDSTHIANQLLKDIGTQKAKSVREAKKIKRVVDEQGESLVEFEKPEWQRVTVILEAIQDKKKLEHGEVLLPVCFQLLARILDSDEHSSAEYIKQLILSLIYNVCSRMSSEQDSEKSSGNNFNMELIVQCIRTSNNPQTERHTLMVLIAAARLYPEHLLHNVMSIFTFMGANILRQDDAYSIQIISKILETVIPALIMACEQRTKIPKGVSNKVEDIISTVIRVFVDAYPHIPEHRRLMLFSKLLEIVGAESYLWRLLLLLTEHFITKGVTASTGGSKEVMSPDVEFYLQLCSQFSAEAQVSSASQAVAYVASLPQEKEHDSPGKKIVLPQSLGKLKKGDAEIFNVKFHSPKQLRHFKYEAVQLLTNILTSRNFLLQVMEGQKVELSSHFETLLKVLLEYLVTVAQAAEVYQEAPTARFWKVYLHKIYDLLEKVVTLLPLEMFYGVMTGLLSHSLPHVQRKAVDILNSHLQKNRDVSIEAQAPMLLPLVDKIQSIAEKSSIKTADKGDNPVTAQTAFYCLKLMCRHFGAKNPHTFVKVLKLCSRIFQERSDNNQLSACALLCIAEICSVLKIHVIAHLNSFIPKMLSSLDNLQKMAGNELFLMSVVTTIQKVVENLAHFLSPYINHIIMQVCVLSTTDLNDVLKKQQLQQQLTVVRSCLAKSLPTRVILPAALTCYNKFSVGQNACILPLMGILEQHITGLPRENLISHLNELEKLCLLCLQFRVEKSEEADEKQVSKIEDSVMAAICSMVMKMSETSFKPFLFKLFDWSKQEGESPIRLLVFYKLCDSLAEKLKSLFTMFASNIVSFTADIMEQNNSAKSNNTSFGKGKTNRKLSHMLLKYVMDCLHKCFVYDMEGFVDKAMYDRLLNPLVDQLENVGKSQKLYSNRVNGHLIPCIVQLAVASQDDQLWKTMNYQILLKTRSSIPEVRFAALRTIDEYHKKLGENYMNLMPETIPFLAELMEDENEEVEKECHSVIVEMEKTLGEPLQKYF